MSKQYVYVKLTKEWGGFKIGDVVRFGYTKGIARIEKGEGVAVKKQDAVNAPLSKPPEVKQPPKAETADMPAPDENAMLTPQPTGKTRRRGQRFRT